MDFLETRTQEEQTGILAQYLRDDPLHQAKNIDGKVLQKVLSGLAVEFLRERDQVNNLYSEYDPNITTQLIEEWEGFVGIPDGCLSNTGTLEERRKNILLKLAGINATTAKQFEAIAAALGFTITVKAAGDVCVFPFIFPFIMCDEASLPFTIIVEIPLALTPNVFPFTFPFVFGEDSTLVLRCFLEAIKPANTLIFFNYI